jgi:hypothetical protein
VADIKCELQELEGVPFEQIVLIHAGQELTNDILLQRHGLADFNQSNEIFVDMQVRPGADQHVCHLLLACMSRWGVLCTTGTANGR